MSDLTVKKCVPCEGGVPSLTPAEVEQLLTQVSGWSADNASQKISKQFKCTSFMDAIAFVNKVADVAQSEDHHPDFHIYYSKVTLELWTHAIGGLSENDFIVAAKIDQIKM